MCVITWDVGVKNLSFCVTNLDATRILAWADLDTSIRRGTSLSRTVKLMCDFLDEYTSSNETFRSFVGSVRTCLIENQPKKNPTMRVVSGILGTYLYKKFGWTPLYFNPAHKLTGVDVGQAFDFFSSQIANDFGAKNKKGGRRARWGSKEAASAYRMRKQASICETRRLLQTETELRIWLPFFERHPKKDDLSDTYLMARAYARGSARFVEEEDSSDSDSKSEAEGEGEGEDGAGGGGGAGGGAGPTTCPLRHILSGPCPVKSKKSDDVLGHAKYCLEERLHKEYGSSDSFDQVVRSILKKSKCKGIVTFRTFLESRACICDRQCDIVPWMFPEAHWRTLFGPSQVTGTTGSGGGP